jgi:putative FmdB family regulatory protein
VPTYEYQCQSCKKRYELQQGFSAETSHVCEKCGKGIAKRQLYAPTVVFKGSGFYATDNKPGRVAKDDSDSSSSGESSKVETKASKPESKPESKKSSGKPDGGSAAEAAL